MIIQGYKRIYAEDLALGLGFEWDYESAEDRDLFEAIEAMGYRWDSDRSSWLFTNDLDQEVPAKLNRQEVRDLEKLRQWNAGEPIRKGSKP